MNLNDFKQKHNDMQQNARQLLVCDEAFEKSTLISRSIYSVLQMFGLTIMVHSFLSIFAMFVGLAMTPSWRIVWWMLGFTANFSVFALISTVLAIRAQVGKCDRSKPEHSLKINKNEFPFYKRWPHGWYANFIQKNITWMEKKYHTQHIEKTQPLMDELLFHTQNLAQWVKDNSVSMYDYLVDNAPIITVGITQKEFDLNVTYMKNVEQFKHFIEKENYIQAAQYFEQCLSMIQDTVIESHEQTELMLQAGV